VLIVIGLGTMFAVMRNPAPFRGTLPPVQTSRSAGIIISGSEFITVPAGSSATMYVAGIDRDRTTNRTINGVVQTEDILTDAALPNGATLQRCIYTGYFGATPIQVSMYCLTYAPTNADIGDHTIVLRAKEFGTGTPSDSPLPVTFNVTGSPSSTDMRATLSSLTPITTPLGLPFVTRFTVGNSGTSTGTNVQLSVNLPTGFGYYPSLSSSYCTHGTGPVVCNLPNFPPNSVAVFDIAMTPLDQTTCLTTVQISGTTTAAGVDPNPTNNTSSPHIVTVSCPPPVSSSSSSSSFDLALISIEGDDPTLNQPHVFQMIVSNSGSGIATNVRVLVPVPSGFGFTPSLSNPLCTREGTNPVSCNLGTFGRRATVLGVALTPLNSNLCNSSTAILAQVTSDESDTNDINLGNNALIFSPTISCSSSSSSSSSENNAGLLFTAVASQTAARGGDLVNTYTLQNTGTVPHNNVTITVPLPTGNGISFKSSAICSPVGSNIVCNLGTLQANMTGITPAAIAYAVGFGATCPSTFTSVATLTSSLLGTPLTRTLQVPITCLPTLSYCCKAGGICEEGVGCSQTQAQCRASCGVNSSSSSSSSSSIPTSALCGNGSIDGTEECDDGKQCAPFGTACTTNADCASGQTCQTWDGDGCFANCSIMFPPDSIFP
jgi:uncharacterized repeat protein (TIGR01451 family)